MKKYFIAKDEQGKMVVRYVCTEIRTHNDDMSALCVTMENSYNLPCLQNTKIEYVYDKDRCETKEKCQMEIIRRERFG